MYTIMTNSTEHQLSESEIISWAIPLIARGHYALSDTAGERELWVTDRKPDISYMEGELLYGRDKTAQQAFLNLRENCCLDNVRTLLVLLLGKSVGERLTLQFADRPLAPRDYELIVAVAYHQETSLVSDFQRLVVKGREGISGSNDSLAAIEQKAIPEAVSVAVVTHYAVELSNLFPRLIRRAEQLRILPAEVRVPAIVERYLEEASKCYLYGCFIGCVVVCRSAIEFSLRERLTKWGQESALNALRQDRNDSLWNMIQLARSVLPYTLRATLTDADKVRVAAKDAVHMSEPQIEVCKETFIRTRGVLAELYSVVPGGTPA
jgi:hypothetical protein